MPDQFGAIEFPVQPQSQDAAVTDPALEAISQYLFAVLNFELSTAWSVVNPGKNFCQSVSTNDPSDGTFNSRDLPGLFVTRQSLTDEQVTDDWTETITEVRALWIPQDAEQSKRALRSPGLNGLQKTISRSLARGRHPAWIDPLDTDPTAQSLGSVLIQRARLFRWPIVTGAKTDRITFDTGQSHATFAGYSVMLRIHEITDWDISLRGTPSALDNTTTQGSLDLESLLTT